MRPYKLKHIPTGLYWQPIKHRGSNLSKRGKIYQTKTNMLNIGYYSDGSPRRILTVYSHKNTLIYRHYKDQFDWQDSSSFNGVKTETPVDDWVKEEI